MTVFVDERRLRQERKPYRETWRSYLSADSQGELHALAAQGGLDPGRFRVVAAIWHYDLTDVERVAAIGAGAVALTHGQFGAWVSARHLLEQDLEVWSVVGHRLRGKVRDRAEPTCETCGHALAVAVRVVDQRGREFGPGVRLCDRCRGEWDRHAAITPAERSRAS